MELPHQSRGCIASSSVLLEVPNSNTVFCRKLHGAAELDRVAVLRRHCLMNQEAPSGWTLRRLQYHSRSTLALWYGLKLFSTTSRLVSALAGCFWVCRVQPRMNLISLTAQVQAIGVSNDNAVQSQSNHGCHNLLIDSLEDWLLVRRYGSASTAIMRTGGGYLLMVAAMALAALIQTSALQAVYASVHHSSATAPMGVAPQVPLSPPFSCPSMLLSISR